MIKPNNYILKKDRIFNTFVKIGVDGKNERIKLEDLQSHVSKISLNVNVPEAAGRVFNASKKLYIFGYFEYYFFAISNHYALLALESALRNKYNSIFDKPKKFKKLKDIIDELVTKHIINNNEKLLYDCARELRNFFSHLTAPPIITPSMCLLTIENIAEHINKLYDLSRNNKN